MSKKILVAWGNAGCVWRTWEQALHLEDPRKNYVRVWWEQGGRSVGWDPGGGGPHGSGGAPGAGEAPRRRRSPASGGSRAEQWRPPRGPRARAARAGSAGLPGARAPEGVSLLFLWPSGRRERACGGSPAEQASGGREEPGSREGATWTRRPGAPGAPGSPLGRLRGRPRAPRRRRAPRAPALRA